jgi:hypothetical protein
MVHWANQHVDVPMSRSSGSASITGMNNRRYRSDD